ncbi:hypothetical protein Bca101_022846 [Brassica carinata]
MGSLAKISTDEEASLYAMQLGSASVLPMVLKAAIELDLLEIMAKNDGFSGAQMSPSKLASHLPTKNPDAHVMLDRILRLLASHSILTCSVRKLPDGDVERLYGLDTVCKYLTNNDDGVSLATHCLLNQDKVLMESWYHLKDAVLEGGIPFDKGYGMPTFVYHGKDQRFANVFNNGMSSHSTIVMKKILEVYNGFEGLSSVVDVGGGIGASLHMIVSNVPTGDAIFLKWVCHDWSDEHCLKLLKNCYDVLPNDGKVIIVECLVPVAPDSSLLTKQVVHLDCVMMAHTAGGRERTEGERSSILEELAFDLLRKAFNSPVMSNLDRFIASKLTHAVTVTSSPAKSLPISSRNRVSQEKMYVDSEAPSLTIQGNGGGSLHIPPQLLALSELEFKKAFLLLTYIPGQKRSRDPTNSRGFLSARSVTGFLSDVYRPAADRVGKIFMIADDRVQGAVFDLPEDIAKELLENEVPEGNIMSLITKLPPLQDDGPSSDNYGRFSSRDRMPRGGGGSRGSRFGGRGGSSRGRDSWGGDDDRRSRSSGGEGSSWSRGGGGGSRGSSDDWLIGGGSDRRLSSSRAPSRERSFGDQEGNPLGFLCEIQAKAKKEMGLKILVLVEASEKVILQPSVSVLLDALEKSISTFRITNDISACLVSHSCKHKDKHK